MNTMATRPPLQAVVEILPVANHDYCDACGKLAVQAHVSVIVDTGEHGTHDVTLCWHHARVRGYNLPAEYRAELAEDNRQKGSDK